MLLRKTIARHAKWVWIVLLALSPVAYIAGMRLVLQYDPNTHAGMGIDRSHAVSIAAQFAAARGVDVSGWDRFCRFKPEDDLLFYYRLRSGAERDLARRLAPEAVVGVRFRSPDRKENIEVLLGPDGRTLGYERRVSRSAEYVDPGEETARKVAEEAIRARLGTVEMSKPVELKPGEATGEGGQTRKYIWKWPLSTLPELKFQSVIYVHGNTLIGDVVEAKVDSDFAVGRLNARSTSHVIRGIVYGLVVLIMVILGIYRFVQRGGQKEISYLRICLITLIFASLTSGFALLSDVVLYEIAGRPGFPLPDLAILFPVVMFYLVIALFLGLAYGSGEGDIRESYHGKLSSLDALIIGKIFSRNVARSVVAGSAIGGWMLLSSELGLLPWTNNPANGRNFGPLDPWFGHAPWLSPFIIGAMDVILVTVVGLLVPLPILHRRPRWKKLAIPLLSVFVWIACSGSYLNFRPQAALLVMGAARTVVVLFSFFMFDLLTVFIALAAPTFIVYSAALIAQPSPSLHISGVASLSIVLSVISIELFFLFKGRLYKDEEVRPVYAREIAERLSMQAEVSAAREAQKRLMPTCLPRTPYFSIAASCIPAFEVGGDFYDLFEIEPGKVGVLIAEGGGRGLGSALSIAFAKGFLMPRITGSRRCDDSPDEIIHSLQTRLTTRIAEDADLGIAYAVIDAVDGTLRYARTADYPSILVRRPGGKLERPEERERQVRSSPHARDNIRLIEGSFSLQPGDSVVLFTHGIAKDWTSNGSSPGAEFAKILDLSRNGATGLLQENLVKAVNDSFRHAKKTGLEDDLTAIIVRLERPDTNAGN